jgi:uncharacterized membrane protein
LAGIDDFRRLRARKMRHAHALLNRVRATISCVASASSIALPSLLRPCPAPHFGFAIIEFAILGLATVTTLTATPAAADFRICNVTKSRVGIAVGYKDGDGWATEGWWNITAGNCETVLRGKLAARFYYIYAVDYDRGGEWSGQAFMCTRDKEFTIRGTGDCLARGYDRTGFFEVDTGEQQTWTVQLTETGEAPKQGVAGSKSFAPLPGSRTLQSLPSTGNPPR